MKSLRTRTTPKGNRSMSLGLNVDKILLAMSERSGQSMTAIIREAIIHLDADWRKDGR